MRYGGFGTKEKIDMIVKIGQAGMDIGQKASELEMFGTCVINACKVKKKKLDSILVDYNDVIKVTEFDTNMWRLTVIGTELTVTQYCKESQWHQ